MDEPMFTSQNVLSIKPTLMNAEPWKHALYKLFLTLLQLDGYISINFNIIVVLLTTLEAAMK